MKRSLFHSFEDIISLDNLLEAWREFLVGKRKKADVLEFSFHLMDNIISLNQDLANYSYHPGGYKSFKVSDPKPRHIHKASVRDRLLHHAVYRQLYPFFDRTFINDSYSCRLGKGTHKALVRFQKYFYKVSYNNTKNCWVLKGDIRKFFASVDQTTLLDILDEYISDRRLLDLLEKIIHSFNSGQPGKGLPLGNLTSQLFANVYLNYFDQFIKHSLKVKYYIRYADDFIIMSDDKACLVDLVEVIGEFLATNLKLEIHPDKLFIKTVSSGIDFLGWTIFPDHLVLRRATKRRMFKKLEINNYKQESLNSYLGLISHGNAKRIEGEILNKAARAEYHRLEI